MNLITPLLKKSIGFAPTICQITGQCKTCFFLSKLVERVTVKQLSTNLDFFNLLVPVKSAYRRHHSSGMTLLRVVNGLETAVDAGDVALLVLLDQSSTFDTIDHFILFIRLSVRYGVTRVELFWIPSYICQTVIYLSASEVSHLLL